MRPPRALLLTGLALLALLGARAVPLEGAAPATTSTVEDEPNPVATEGGVQEAEVATDGDSAAATSTSSSFPSQQPAMELEAAGSEERPTAYLGQVMIPDQTAAAATFDPSIYAGLVSADAFQQYMSQFGGGLAAPYGPYAPAPYPAPVGYAAAPPPAPYPGPYVMQTGYEGFLVPTTAATSSATSTTSTTGGSTTTTVLSPLGLLRELLPSLMMSSVFRVLAMLLSAVGVVFFGGAITTAICSFTPICDITFKAVTYMRHRGAAETVGRMLAEGMTPERVRRTTDFVWKAIRKYNDLQKALRSDDGYGDGDGADD